MALLFFVGKLQTFQFSLLIILALTSVLQAQDQTGFISIDCGLPDTTTNYNDTNTELSYVSDSGYIDSGISKSVATEHLSTHPAERQLQNLRSFPEGDRNCYEIQLKIGTKYLIRAVFMYGNYDGKNTTPIFDLYLGSKKWDTIDTVSSTNINTREIIHMTTANFVHICLVNTGFGTPFISTLELRPLPEATYSTNFGSLALFRRLDIGSITNQAVRYPGDVYDRIWTPHLFYKWEELNTTETVTNSRNYFKPPSIVMRSAGRAANPDEPMELSLDTSLRFLVFMYFAEIETQEEGESRIFNISLNGAFWYGPVNPPYLSSVTVFSTALVPGKFKFSLFKVQNSTRPPLINAIEVFSVLNLSQSYTKQEDVYGIKNIKNSYKIKGNWQGDPCAPQEYTWDGLNCSYPENDEPKIISLNLSSMGLTGEILPSISDLKSLESLDLSNNDLTGSVPDFLSKFSSLKFLNLSANKLSGSVPASLLEKSNQKVMELSVDGNANLCASTSCKNKNNKGGLIVASIAGVIVLVAIVAALSYMLIKRRRKPQGTEQNEYEVLEMKRRHFTYSDVLSMTNNFQKILGKGGFGTVYLGKLDDDSQVAVKMLSPSSTQGYKQFQAEVRLLLRVHHRNLTSLVGFCDEGTNMALIYEYMANGDIQNFISGSNSDAFPWERRLQVVGEAAQGLEYLHNGCKPPIVHRDIKPSNILLNEKFQAKLADFGLSRSLPLEGETHISTVLAGTPGYLDPECYETNWITEKSDVYSFGIVLLNIITGSPVYRRVDGENTHICKWVKSLLENGDIRSVVDPNLGEDFDMNSAWKATEIAMACASPTSSSRPTMHQVVIELNQCLPEETARMKQTKMEIMSDTAPLAR